MTSADETREALEAIEARFRFLAEFVPVQIWTALPDGALDYVTEQTARHFGLPAESILQSGWQDVVHPDDLPEAGKRWLHSLQSGEPYEVEFRLRLADGNFAWHLARATAQRDGVGKIVRWFGTNTNIEPQREEQRRIRALLNEVVEQSREQVATVTSLRRRIEDLEAQLAAAKDER